MTEPLIHSFETDCLPEEHPFAHQTLGCQCCGTMVHAFNNECMTEWVEWDGSVLCLDCFCTEFRSDLSLARFKAVASRYWPDRAVIE